MTFKPNYPNTTDLSDTDRLERHIRLIWDSMSQVANSIPVVPSNTDINALISGQVGTLSKQLIDTIRTQLQSPGQAPLNTQNLLGNPFGTATTNVPGSSGTDINWSNGTLEVPDAGAAARGVVNTGAQTFGGAKTFSSVIIQTTIKLHVYTVSTLPSGSEGMLVGVSNLLAPTFLAPVVGGGTVHGLAYYDGTNWVAV